MRRADCARYRARALIATERSRKRSAKLSISTEYQLHAVEDADDVKATAVAPELGAFCGLQGPDSQTLSALVAIHASQHVERLRWA